jgi:hypothetical protein
MNLERFIPFYRRESEEPTGAVRVSAITTVAAEQMPGGRAQISARTMAGEQQFLSPLLPNYKISLDMLEKFRLFCGGEAEENPSDTWIKRLDDERQASEDVKEAAVRAEQEVVSKVWRPPSEALV